MVLIGAYFASTVFMMLTLLNNSDISLALLNYLKPSTTNILAFLSVALQIIGAAILLIRIKTLNSNQSKYKIVAAVLATTTIFLLFFNLIKTTITFYSLAYWLPISILILFPQANRLKSYRLTSLLIFAVLTAMYINLIAHHYIEKKRSKEQQKINQANRIFTVYAVAFVIAILAELTQKISSISYIHECVPLAIVLPLGSVCYATKNMIS